jgi:membrane protease YdiL (CAAX protease family)
MFGVSTPIEIVYIIPYLLLSFGIGYGFYKSGNILMSTVIHILNNILAIMIILL